MLIRRRRKASLPFAGSASCVHADGCALGATDGSDDPQHHGAGMPSRFSCSTVRTAYPKVPISPLGTVPGTVSVRRESHLTEGHAQPDAVVASMSSWR